MTTSKQTTPKLAVNIPLSKANATANRLEALVPTLSSDLSPSFVYLPGANNEVVKNASVLTSNDYGWTAPDLNNGQPYTVQVECFGAGGGGGGGAATGVGGGGGGGGGEYACEPLYPVTPGKTYSYFCGKGGLGGKTSALINGVPAFPGANGQITSFDLVGRGLTAGVVANGGFGGDQQGQGLGGRGGTGSANTVHFDGGLGGTSSSGIMSDNPNTGLGLSHTYGWWRLDDAVGKTTAQDYSSSRNDIGISRNHGAIVAPVASPVAPLQVPFGPANNWWGGSAPGETQGNCWQWDHGVSSGYIGGLVTSFHTTALTGLTVGAWVKGSPTASFAGDWTDGTHTSGMIVTSVDAQNAGTSKGWMFFLGNLGTTSTINFTGVRADGSVFSAQSTSGPSAVDGNWHFVLVSWTPGTNNTVIYVDGAAVLTTTSTIAQIATSSQTVSVGFNQATNSFSFKGYMSNVYVSTAAASSTYVTTAYGSTVATGGSGGGASGGSAGTGNNGVTAGGGTGGAGGGSAAASNPGINNGSGAGGAGGNSNSAGGNAPSVLPYAGGGGGAGADTSAVPGAFTLEVPCQMSASYAGLDASGAAEGQLYTVSANPVANGTDPWYNTAAKQDAICYSGGTSDAPFKGSMNTLLTFPSLASIDAQSGNVTSYLASGNWTVQKTYLKLTVESPGASMIILGLWGSNAIISMLDSDTTLGTWGYGGAALTAYIPAGDPGRQVYIDLSGTSIMSTMISTAYSNGYSQSGRALQGAGLLIGTLQGSPTHQGNINGAWNSDTDVDWYTAFHGADPDPTISAALEIYYTAAGASLVSAGNGSDGYIVIRYINPQGTPVATVLPQTTTDASGNTHGPGFTATPANYNVWQPGSSPLIVEVPHTFSPVNGWVVANSVTACYELCPGNLLYLNFSVNGNAATNSNVTTLPGGWVPASGHILPLAPNSASAPVAWCTVATNGHVTITTTAGAIPAGNFTYSLSAVIKLDV